MKTEELFQGLQAELGELLIQIQTTIALSAVLMFIVALILFLLLNRRVRTYGDLIYGVDKDVEGNSRKIEKLRSERDETSIEQLLRDTEKLLHILQTMEAPRAAPFKTVPRGADSIEDEVVLRLVAILPFYKVLEASSPVNILEGVRHGLASFKEIAGRDPLLDYADEIDDVCYLAHGWIMQNWVNQELGRHIFKLGTNRTIKRATTVPGHKKTHWGPR